MNQAGSPLIQKLREQCLRRGASGIKGIGRMWTQIDDDENRSLDLKEFQEGILNHNISFTIDEIQQLFKEFDKDNSGNFLSFLFRIIAHT